jgi:prophage antirepressor-like protein
MGELQMIQDRAGQRNSVPEVFKYDSKQVRVIMRDGEPWWVLKDVCDILNLSNPSAVANRLDEDEKLKG